MEGLRALENDLSISDDDKVLRIVRPDTIDWELPVPRARSNAFQQQTEDAAARFGLSGPCLSVTLRSVWIEQSGKVEDLLVKFDVTFGVVAIPVAAVRNLVRLSGQAQPQGIMRDQTDDPWHAVIWDLSLSPRVKAAEKALSEAVTEWVHTPARPTSS